MYLCCKQTVMKNKSFIFCVLALACLISSCGKEDTKGPADNFIGVYSFEDTYSYTWGERSGSATSSGTFEIRKVSSDKVSFTIPWQTNATVSGGQLILDPVRQSSQSDYVNYTFEPASFSGFTLTINYQGTGSMKSTDNRSYPYSCQGTLTAVKQPSTE